MKKSFSVILIVSFLLFTSAFSPKISAEPLPTPTLNLNYVMIDGEKVFFERIVEGDTVTGIAKTENGEVITEFVLDRATNEAELDGVALTSEEYNEIMYLASEEFTSLDNPEPSPVENSLFITDSTVSNDAVYASATCNYQTIGSMKFRSTWIPKVGVAAVAAAIAVAVPAVGWSIAYSIASVVAGSSNTLYYTVREYSCYSNGLYRLKTTRTFYKNSNYSGYITRHSAYGSRK